MPNYNNSVQLDVYRPGVKQYETFIYNNFVQQRLDQNQVFRLLFFTAEKRISLEKGLSGDYVFKKIVAGAILIPTFITEFRHSDYFKFYSILGLFADDLTTMLKNILSTDSEQNTNQKKDSKLPYNTFCEHLDQHLKELADLHGPEVFEKKYKISGLVDFVRGLPVMKPEA